MGSGLKHFLAFIGPESRVSDLLLMRSLSHFKVLSQVDLSNYLALTGCRMAPSNWAWVRKRLEGYPSSFQWRKSVERERWKCV